jgi:hypothetical protein
VALAAILMTTRGLPFANFGDQGLAAIGYASQTMTVRAYFVFF